LVIFTAAPVTSVTVCVPDAAELPELVAPPDPVDPADPGDPLEPQAASKATTGATASAVSRQDLLDFLFIAIFPLSLGVVTMRLQNQPGHKTTHGSALTFVPRG
jgi:hypothetical protein